MNSENISPITKRRISAEESKENAEFWIEFYKFKQNLISKLQDLKEETENDKKIQEISNFKREEELLCDNLYKMKQILSISQTKLETNYDKIENKNKEDEIYKTQIKDIYSKNLEKFRNITKRMDNIDVQEKCKLSFVYGREKANEKILNFSNLITSDIDANIKKLYLDEKYRQKILMTGRFFIRIFKFRIIDFFQDKKDKNLNVIRGYFYDKDIQIPLKYDIKFRNNEDVEISSARALDFWETLVKYYEKKNRKKIDTNKNEKIY